MNQWKRRWTFVGVLLSVLMRVACAQVATTTVQDTVYSADGTAASGSVVVSWNAFTTAGGSSVPSGTTSAPIGAGGLLTIALAPNAGATPMGSYYTAVYHLGDGSTSREYWVIPVTVAGGGPVKLSAIRASVLPASVAMQTVSKAYVDTAIAAAVAGHPLDSSPYVLKTGDTMTGPLALPADPVSDFQAADKHYVDENIAATAAGLGRKVDELPGTTQVVAQPTGTQLEVNDLNGTLYASQYTVLGTGGVANALATPDCAGGCDVVVEDTYPATDGASLAQIPAKARLTDERGGEDAITAVDSLSPIAGGNSTATSLSLVNTRKVSDVKAAFPGNNGVISTSLNIASTSVSGGSNQFPGDVEAVPYFKSTYSATNITGVSNTLGQHVLNNNSTYCYGVGDCLLGSQFIRASGGTRDEADEGAHPFDIDIAEDTNVFEATCATGCTLGSTVVTVTPTAGAGTQGEGRFVIDKNPADVISAGTLVSGAQGTPFARADFSGTSFAVTTFLATAAAATSQATNIAPGTVTLPIATSSVPAGFATNTAALPSGSGVACVADPHAYGAAGFANFEMANYSVVDGTHVQLTLNKVHASGTVIAVGGLCGYGLEQTVDTVGQIRQVFPVVGSTSATELYYTDARTPIVGIPGTTSAFQNIHQSVAAISRTSNVVTVTMTSSLTDVTGLTLTVSGVADSSYNGNYVVTATGSNTLTYADSGPNSTSSGGTVSLLTGGYALYPMAEVLGVLNPATKSVDGYLQLGANTVPWASGDSVEEPHYFQEDIYTDLQKVTQYTPRPTGYDRAGVIFVGNVGPGVRGWSVQNLAGGGSYLGSGGLHSPPDSAYEAIGTWNSILTTPAGNQSLFRVTCNSRGCSRFDSTYALFLMDSAAGFDQLLYSPQSSTAQWLLGGTPYTFTPTSFTAGTINVGTLNASTITGGVSGAAITSGTISAARLPVFGPSGTTHSAGIVPDPGATAGSTRFLREDGTFAVPAGGSGGLGYTLLVRGSSNVAASNTYNVGADGDVVTTASGHAATAFVTVPRTATIKSIEYKVLPNATVISTACTMQIANAVTGTVVASTPVTVNASGFYPVTSVLTGLSIAVNTGDEYQLQLVVPAGATSATNSIIAAVLYLE